MQFDIDGTCLRVPFPACEEAEGERWRCSIRQGSYKAFERHGPVFADMGPPDPEPPFLEWEGNFTVTEGDERLPCMHFVPAQGGRSLACAGAHRADDGHMFIRVQHQWLPNLSLHAYTSADGKKKKLFTRFDLIRWTVPVDGPNAKMLGWRVMGRASPFQVLVQATRNEKRHCHHRLEMSRCQRHPSACKPGCAARPQPMVR